MEESIKTQLNIIDMEGLIYSEANLPQFNYYEKEFSIIIKNKDLHVLCKMAKANNVEVILYSKNRINEQDYYINKSELCEELQAILPIIEMEIDEYNLNAKEYQKLEMDSITFYFVSKGKFYIQSIQCVDEEKRILKSDDKLNYILEKYSVEVDRERRKIEEKKLLEQERREQLLLGFKEFVKQDSLFAEYYSEDRHSMYAQNIFIVHPELEQYRTLFFGEDDINCEKRNSIYSCKLEVDKIYQEMRAERETYAKTEEYKQRMLAFEDFVRKDDSFWKYTSPGTRRDYARKVFLINSKVKEYRSLFYMDADIECVDYKSQMSCYYELERIYTSGRMKSNS